MTGTRTPWFAAAVLALGACFGVAMRQQDPPPTGGQEPTAGSPPAPATIAAGEPIDQDHVLPLAPVRAPKGFGDRAFDHVRALVEFGPRYAGTPGWTKQLRYIEAELQRHGLPVQIDTWTDRKERITFTNLRATIPGRRRERIVLACHHDTKCTTGHAEPEHNFHFVGANDGASGVAVLLELAPVLLASPRDATIDLVFFDGEESLDWSWNQAARALFGSRRFVQRHRDAALLDPAKEPPIAALVLLDMVGRSDLHLQEELYSTPLLRQVQWGAAVALGMQEQVFRRAEAASDDHKPFLEVGIPAVDLIDLNGNPHWHQPTDTLANVASASLQASADLVLTMLPAVERHYVLRQD